MAVSRVKANGAYYTPTDVARTLVAWAIRGAKDRLLDPSCGEGEFLMPHPNSTGVEQDVAAVAQAARRTNARIHVTDFFEWSAKTNERFDCIVGNPPFIRYQRFCGEIRQRALAVCSNADVRFSGLTASWAPFLVASTTVLDPVGDCRLSFPLRLVTPRMLFRSSNISRGVSMIYGS